MSKHDEQMDRELQQALDQIDIPAPDLDARRRAIAMARSEFDAAQQEQAGVTHVAVKSTGSGAQAGPQGFLERLRHMVGRGSDNRRRTMDISHKPAYTGIAAFATVTIAAVIGLPLMPDRPANYSGYPESSVGMVKVAPQGTIASRADYSDVASAQSRLNAKRKVPADVEADIALDYGSPSAYQPKALEEIVVSAPSASEPPREIVADAVVMARMAVGDSDLAAQPRYAEQGRDSFEAFEQNRVYLVSEQPVSTFSADVDTAAYSFVRRMLNAGTLPQGDAVRVEEMINYFDYDYPLPESKAQPFKPTVTVSDSPWAPGRKLIHIGVKAYDIAPAATPRSNLVFLLDVSGSMNSPDKLPLVKQSMEMLLSSLQPEDTVAIAVYAGAAGVVLEPTPVKDKGKILGALRQLNAGGSTAGGAGIRLAYELARQQFDENAVNRVILATDGDFNVGITNPRELQGFVERQREEGIYLSVLGFGQGNYQDSMMQTLAQNGNGVAVYIDTLSEAQKVLVDEATSSLFPIARDVKFQVEFNPATVSEYRLIGYETRHLNREDFNNDAVDAGDIGAGHTVTAIYEFTPAGSAASLIEERRYAPAAAVDREGGEEYAFLKIRYKLPEEEQSRLITRPVTPRDSVVLGKGVAGREAGFATAVAGFAQLLKGGRYTGDYGYDDVIALGLANRGDDPYGYRSEFVQLVRKAVTVRGLQY